MSLNEALARAADGDRIELASGDYRAPSAVIAHRRLTLSGAEPRPRLIAAGSSAEGKAIWVVRGGEILIENIEFRGARVADRNGAGIRFERGRLHLRRCVFVDNEMGLLASNNPEAELFIEDSRFAQGVAIDGGYSHLLYVGRIGLLRVEGSRFEQGRNGHLLKSRARRSELRYNRLIDGPAGRASHEVDLPDGGDALLLGNVIAQGAHGGNEVLIAYGAEGRVWPSNRLRLLHNTLINERGLPAPLLRVWPGALDELLVQNNLLVGPALLATGLQGNLVGNPRRGLDALRPQDQGLREAAGAEVDAVGDAALRPQAEPLAPLGRRPLRPPARWVAGALQR